eukprot:6211900-Pleurochrysis_carterae.AAC.1
MRPRLPSLRRASFSLHACARASYSLRTLPRRQVGQCAISSPWLLLLTHARTHKVSSCVAAQEKVAALSDSFATIAMADEATIATK